MPTTRLAAIMFTDIVGYTSMMQQNREQAMHSVRAYETSLKKLIKAQGGELLQTYGDGSLSIFDSASAAVQCAKELQESIRDTVPLRIGIHLGEITLDGDHIFGDGVNIASRIESIGVAGAVLVSSSIRQQIKNNPGFELVSLGKFSFKNVAEPMTVYALANEGLTVPDSADLGINEPFIPKSAKEKKSGNLNRNFIIGIIAVMAVLGMWLGIPWKNETQDKTPQPAPSIAVLPFDNLNRDPDQEYFSDGIADEIRVKLSGVSRLKVISRTSSMFFKGKQVSMSAIAEQLDVNYIMEGSVQRIDDHLKIHVQLTNAITDELEWAPQPFEGNIRDVFSFQKEIATEVMKAIDQQMSMAEKERLERSYTNDPLVYDLYLQAKKTSWSGNPEVFSYAKGLLEEVLEKEPDFVPAMAGLAEIYFWEGTLFGSLSPKEAREKSMYYIERVKNIDSEYGMIHGIEGMVLTFFDWDFKAGELAYQKAIAFGFAEAKLSLYVLYTKTGAFEKIGNLPDEVADIDPLQPYTQFRKGPMYLFKGEYPKAITIYEKVVEDYAYFADAYRYLGKAYLYQGEFEKAQQTLEKGLQVSDRRYPFLLADLGIACYKTGQLQKFNDIMFELEEQWKKQSGGDPAFFLGQLNAGVERVEKALFWLEKAYEAREVEMTWLKMEPAFRSLHGHPKYQELVSNIGL